MTQFIVRRLILALPTLLLAITLVFVLVRLVPGDAVTLLLDNSQYSEADAEAMRERLGINDPLIVQYGTFMKQVLTGDFGESIWTGRSVTSVLFTEKLPITLELTVFSLLFGTLMGIPAGIVAALKQDSVWDFLVRVVAIGGLSVPGFWVGTMVLVLPAFWWGWSLPVGYQSFWDDPWVHAQQILIPAFVMSIILAAILMRMARSMMLEVMKQDYARTATAKGLHNRVVVIRHCLRNAMLPLVSIIGVQAVVLLSGTIIYESVFTIPGVGLYVFDGLSRRDYPVIEGVAIMLTVLVVLINIAVDLSYRFLDPRVQLS